MPELMARVPCAPQLLALFRASSPGRAEAAWWGAALGLPQRFSLLSSGRFPRPAALPAAGGRWTAPERGGGSAAIWVEGEAERWPQPGNGLHAAFPPAMTPGVGSTHGQELVGLLPKGSADAMGEQVLGNLVSSDFSSTSRARLSPEQSHYTTFCKMPRVGSSPKPLPLAPKGSVEGGAPGGRCWCCWSCNGSQPSFHRHAGGGREPGCFPSQPQLLHAGHQSCYWYLS